MSAALAVWVLSATTSPVWGQDNPGAGRAVTDRARAAWESRQARAKAFRVRWTEELTRHKGYFALLLPPPGGGAYPARDLLGTTTCTLSVDGGKVKYAYQGTNWSPKEQSLKPTTYAGAFVEGESTTFSNPMGDEPYPQAVLQNARKSDDVSAVAVLPVVLALRGTHPEFVRRDLAAYEPTGRRVPVESRSCDELVFETRTDGLRELLYLDPEREFVPVRLDTFVKDTLTFRLTVTYDADPAVGWHPRAWTSVAQSPAGVPLESARTRVTEFAVNPALPPDEFRIDLPPGTRVLDQRNGADVQYVVRDDGRAGRAVPSQSDPSYDDLRAAGPDRSPIVRIAIAGATVAAVAIAAAAIWYWRRHRPRAV
jgi:hypothetical protein